MEHFNQSYILIAAFLCSIVLCMFSIPNIIYVTKKKRLFDVPDGNRKVHTEIIPNLGGVGIFFAFMMVTSLFINQGQSVTWNFIATASLLLFITGIKDDLVGVSAGKKLIAQLVAGFIVAYFGNIQLNNLQGFLGIYQIPFYLSLPFTIIGITFVTNALNLIDGVDGLAGSVSLLASFLLGSFLFLEGNLAMAIMAFTLMGSIAGFLYYNMSPAKIFMGDTGSLLLGFTLSILAISFVNSYDATKEINQLVISPSGAIVLASSILFIPLFDTFRVFGKRILNKRSPFSADKIHLHHYLLDAGCNHKQVVYITFVANILLVVAALTLQYLNINIAIAALFAIGMGLVSLLAYLRKRKNGQGTLELKVKKVAASKSMRKHLSEVDEVLINNP